MQRKKGDVVSVTGLFSGFPTGSDAPTVLALQKVERLEPIGRPPDETLGDQGLKQHLESRAALFSGNGKQFQETPRLGCDCLKDNPPDLGHLSSAIAMQLVAFIH
jgi:hypothetical protein